MKHCIVIEKDYCTICYFIVRVTSEVRITSLPFSSSEESSSVLLLLKIWEFLGGQLSVMVLHQFLHIIIIIHLQAKKHNVLHNRYRLILKTLKVSFRNTLRSQFLPGYLHGPGRHCPTYFVYEPQASEAITSKMFLTELPYIKLVSQVIPKYL